MRTSWKLDNKEWKISFIITGRELFGNITTSESVDKALEHLIDTLEATRKDAIPKWKDARKTLRRRVDEMEDTENDLGLTIQERIQNAITAHKDYLKRMEQVWNQEALNLLKHTWAEILERRDKERRTETADLTVSINNRIWAVETLWVMMNALETQIENSTTMSLIEINLYNKYPPREP